MKDCLTMCDGVKPIIILENTQKILHITVNSKVILLNYNYATD